MKSLSTQSLVDRVYDFQRSLHKYASEHASPGKEAWHALTVLQLRTLLFVQAQQPINMRDVAKKLHITPSSTSLLVTRLVRTGWLKRTADAGDRRVTYLSLSTQAEKRMEQMSKHRTERMQKLFSKLDAADIRAFHRILDKLEKALHNEINERPKKSL
jgi:DNA-binding MarR family transcriptional regulator